MTQDDYDQRAETLHKSARRIYDTWRDKGVTPRQAYEIACAAYSDEKRYKELTKGTK